jgi:hypothetical protein
LIESLLIRTLPNITGKKSVDYMKEPPAYLTNDAVKLINSLNIKHLLLDLPSIDRQFDDGKLSSHHLFWGLDENNNVVNTNYSNKTITEMIYIDNIITDDIYFLQINIAPFELDASPSKPLIYNINFDKN